MQFADIRYKVELALLAIGLLGNLFLWFESDWFRGCEAYFGLFVSTFFTVATGAGKLPPKYKIAGRTIAIFFLINFQETAICNARKVFDSDGNSGSPNDDTTRLVRAGTFFALFTTYFIFAERILLPDTDKPLSSLIKLDNFKSIRNLMFIVAVVLLCICQCLSWGVKDVCTSPPHNSMPLNMTPLTYALLLALGVITNDTELMDLGVFAVTYGGISQFRPIFNTDGASFAQDNYLHIWKAQMAFGFMALLLVVIGQLIHSARFCGRSDGLSIVQRVMRPKTYALIFLVVFGLSGGACVWARVPAKGEDNATYVEASEAWFASIGGLVVPLLSLAAVLTSTKAFGIIGIFLAASSSLPIVSYLTAAGATTGYVRAGLVIVLFVLGVTPLLALSEGVRVADDPDVYFQGTNRTPMALCLMQGAVALLYWSDGNIQYHALFVVIAMCSALFFFSASNGDTSSYKTVMYFFYAYLTNGLLWPLDRSQFVSTPANIAFVLIGWGTIAFVNTLIPGAAFDCFHVDPEFSGIEQDTAKPFITTDEQASYVPPDAEIRKYDNTAAAPPPTKDVETVEESYITSD